MTIPKEIREELEWKQGDTLLIETTSDVFPNQFDKDIIPGITVSMTRE